MYKTHLLSLSSSCTLNLNLPFSPFLVSQRQPLSLHKRNLQRGDFNTSNLQLANSSMEYDPLYDAEKGFKVMPSSFHDISYVEFQDNWGRVWVDLGTSDIFALDVLLNSLTVVSSEYLGIQQVVFGGKRMGDWEEGMTDPDFGYKYFKI
ncbi:hypothetical protein Bca52824_050696 [Brassica carinata]|uniref:Uncharacterized protein n=3 Tax=Brassica TaxID=3705 RepID=A0A8X7R0G4_BRACI|nr:hypothetical protein Bca52824_050696 [Brassica carinata]